MSQKLSETEVRLLENLFDGLDRLLDHQCQVVDVYAITFATAHALEPYPPLSLREYSEALLKTIRSGEATKTNASEHWR